MLFMVLITCEKKACLHEKQLGHIKTTVLVFGVSSQSGIRSGCILFTTLCVCIAD